MYLSGFADYPPLKSRAFLKRAVGFYTILNTFLLMGDGPKLTLGMGRSVDVKDIGELTVHSFNLDYGIVTEAIKLQSRRNYYEGGIQKLYFSEQVDLDLMARLDDATRDRYRTHRINGGSTSYHSKDTKYFHVNGEIFLNP